MKLNLVIKNIVAMYLNENTPQNVADKYSKKNVMYHCSDNFRYEFKLGHIKGGYRGIHGWGIYFASTAFKASDYGDYMTIVDKSNLKLLPLDNKITDAFIQEIEDDLYFGDIRKEININQDYKIFKDFNVYNVSDLEILYTKLSNQLSIVRNNIDYNEIKGIMTKIKELYLLVNPNKENKEIFYELKKHNGKTINDLIIHIFNQKPKKYEKYISLFFSECGYDGFDYDKYEFVIFKTDNLKIVDHIKIR